MIDPGIPPSDRKGLLADIERTHGRLMALLDRLDEAGFVAPVTAGDWAVRDHLAHMAAMTRGVQAILRGSDPWRSIGLDPAKVAGVKDGDKRNAIVREHLLPLTPDQVRTLFDEARCDLLTTIRSLPDATLNLPYGYLDPWASGRAAYIPVVEWIWEQTHYHWLEHIGWLWTGLAERSVPLLEVAPEADPLATATEPPIALAGLALETDPEAFIRAYGRAWDTRNLAALLAAYHIPSFTYKQGQVYTHRTAKEKQRYFSALLDSYVAAGFDHSEITEMECRILNQDNAFASVHWLLYRADGSGMDDFWDSYHLGRGEGGWKIMHDTVHKA
jgi:hypothetical protein